MDNFFSIHRFREGFTSLINGSSQTVSNGNNSTDSSSDENTVKGGKVARHVDYADGSKTAQKVSTAYACIRILSDAMGSCPLQYQMWDEVKKCYRNLDETKGGRVTPLSRLAYLLTVRPNKRLTAFQFWKNVSTKLDLEGNAYAMLKGDMPEYDELVLLEGVNYFKDSDSYTVNDLTNGVFGEFSSSKILHFKNVSLDGGYTGVSTIFFAATQLNIANTAASETLDVYARGGIGKYIYHQPDETANFTTMTDQQMADVVEDLQQQLNQKNDINIMRGSGKLDAMQMDAQQQQFLAKEEFNVKEIARFFGVPLGKLGENSSSNYKSVDEANLMLYSEGLRPRFTNIEQELNAKLIPWKLFTTYRFKFDTSGLYLTDPTTREDYLAKCLGNGTATVNEARAIKNLPPVEGGDRLLISANLKGIDDGVIGDNGAYALGDNDNAGDEGDVSPLKD